MLDVEKDMEDLIKLPDVEKSRLKREFIDRLANNTIKLARGMTDLHKAIIAANENLISLGLRVQELEKSLKASPMKEPKKRGRPRKTPQNDNAPKRKRGRPRKNPETSTRGKGL